MSEPDFGRYWFILDGHIPVAVHPHAWSKWFESSWPERRVRHMTENGYLVSTVFMGIDHNYGEPPPLLFESMVFDPTGGPLEQERCSTWEEAEELHEEMVTRMRQLASESAPPDNAPDNEGSKGPKTDNVR